jgi:D-citramalate synthase
LGVLSPWLTEEYIRKTIERFPKTNFDFHAHNYYDMSTANTLAAIKAGVSGVHTTLNTLGERAGNCSLYTISAGAKDFLGIDLGIDEKSFYEISRLVEGASKMRLQPNAPVVGENAHKQTAGVHADGDSKGDLYKTRLSAERFGKEEVVYSLGKQAGVASVEMNLRKMGINVDAETKKAITQRVRELGALGKTVTQADLFFIVNDAIEQPKEMPFKFLEATSNVSWTGVRTGYVKVKVHGKEFENTAIGDGGYDAIMNALRPILSKEGVELPELKDYQPRIPPGGKTNALVETVIRWGNGNGGFTTIGVDADQTISAVRATEKMINLTMMKYKKD